jgi:hypothetical protein
MLDEALGEYDSATKVKNVTVCMGTPADKSMTREIKELYGDVTKMLHQ